MTKLEQHLIDEQIHYSEDAIKHLNNIMKIYKKHKSVQFRSCLNDCVAALQDLRTVTRYFNKLKILQTNKKLLLLHDHATGGAYPVVEYLFHHINNNYDARRGPHIDELIKRAKKQINFHITDISNFSKTITY